MGATLCVPLPLPRPQGRFGTWWAVPNPTQSGLAPCDASVPPTKMESHCQLLYTQGCLSIRLSFPPSEQLQEAAPAWPGHSSSRCLSVRPKAWGQPAGAFGLGVQSLTAPNLNPALAGSLLRAGSAGTDPSPVVSLSPHLPFLPSTSTSVQPEIQRERAVPPSART